MIFFSILLWSGIWIGFLGKMEKRGWRHLSDGATRRVASRPAPSIRPSVPFPPPLPLPSRPSLKRSLRRGVERASTRVHAASELIIVCELRPCFITAFCVNRSDRCKSCSHYRERLIDIRGRAPLIVFDSGSVFFSNKDTSLINVSLLLFGAARLLTMEKAETRLKVFVIIDVYRAVFYLDKPMLLFCRDYNLLTCWRN